LPPNIVLTHRFFLQIGAKERADERTRTAELLIRSELLHMSPHTALPGKGAYINHNLRFSRKRKFAVYRRMPLALSSKLSSTAALATSSVVLLSPGPAGSKSRTVPQHARTSKAEPFSRTQRSWSKPSAREGGTSLLAVAYMATSGTRALHSRRALRARHSRTPDSK
jgi:hypothetical protein